MTETGEAKRRGDRPIGFRPMYRQVKEKLVGRIADGTWAPGMMVPSEVQVAADLGVSQGTVRKAMDEMAAESLLVRRQGRGTFVACLDDARILFQFFRIVPDVGERALPDSKVLSVSRVIDPEAAGRLGLASDAPIVDVERVRYLGDIACIHERIALPAVLFPDIESGPPLPNNIYALFASRYGVTVAGARERLKAVAAGPRQVELIGASPGEPLMAIDRLATGLDEAPVEWRRSWCRTVAHHYVNDLR